MIRVDLKNPEKLHVLHNDHPLTPEKLAVNHTRLSSYCKKIANEYGIKVVEVMKLIQSLGDKINFALHYKNHQLYLSLKMKLTKIHKVLKFK